MESMKLAFTPFEKGNMDFIALVIGMILTSFGMTLWRKPKSKFGREIIMNVFFPVALKINSGCGHVKQPSKPQASGPLWSRGRESDFPIAP